MQYSVKPQLLVAVKWAKRRFGFFFFFFSFRNSKKKKIERGQQHHSPSPEIKTKTHDEARSVWERETEFDRETKSPKVRSVLRVHLPQRSVRSEADCAKLSGQGVNGAIGSGSGHQGTEGAEAWPE